LPFFAPSTPRQRLDHADHIGIGTDADRDDIATRGDLRQRRRRDTQFSGKRIGLRLATVTDGGQQAMCMEMTGHRRAHRAETDKCSLQGHGSVSSQAAGVSAR
jgi:hypothetical protein